MLAAYLRDGCTEARDDRRTECDVSGRAVVSDVDWSECAVVVCRAAADHVIRKLHLILADHHLTRVVQLQHRKVMKLISRCHDVNNRNIAIAGKRIFRKFNGAQHNMTTTKIRVYLRY